MWFGEEQVWKWHRLFGWYGWEQTSEEGDGLVGSGGERASEMVRSVSLFLAGEMSGVIRRKYAT